MKKLIPALIAFLTIRKAEGIQVLLDSQTDIKKDDVVYVPVGS